MKFVSLIALVIVLNLTWSFFNSKAPISEATHQEIQIGLKDFIMNYISDSVPTATDINFQKFWSETISDKSMKVTFVYSFKDENAEIGSSRVELRGNAIINKVAKNDQWEIDELNVLNNLVEFETPLVIRSHSNNAK